MYYSDFIQPGEAYLAHHGVKGQKWGVRHDRGDRIGRKKRYKYTPVKVPSASKDPIGYAAAKIKNFALKDVRDATTGEKLLAVGLGVLAGGSAAATIATGAQIARIFQDIQMSQVAMEQRRAAVQTRMAQQQADFQSRYDRITRNIDNARTYNNSTTYWENANVRHW